MMKKLYRIQLIDNDCYNDDEIYIKLTSEEARIIIAFVKYCSLTNNIIIDAVDDIEVGELSNE